jgi:transposase
MGTGEQAIAGRKATRRYRTREERRRIVEETLSSGESVATVARAHGVNANMVFHWRKLYQAGLLGSCSSEAEASPLRLLPVTVNDEPATEEEREAVPAECATGSINIEFPGRALVSVVGCADPAVIRAVLESLRG